MVLTPTNEKAFPRKWKGFVLLKRESLLSNAERKTKTVSERSERKAFSF